MSRIRQVKPEFFNDQKMAQLKEGTASMYIGLWTMCDDYGITCGGPMEIKRELYFHRREIDEFEIASRILQLESIGRIIRFKIEGESYMFLPKLLEHQYIRKPSLRPRISWQKMARYVPITAIPKTYRDGLIVAHQFMAFIKSTLPAPARELFDNVPHAVPHETSDVPRNPLTFPSYGNCEQTDNYPQEIPQKRVDHSSPTGNRLPLMGKGMGKDMGMGILLSEEERNENVENDVENRPAFGQPEKGVSMPFFGAGLSNGANGQKNEKRAKMGTVGAIPTLPECVEYFKSIATEWTPQAAATEANLFFQHNQATGWMVGGAPVVSWHSLATGWYSRKLARSPSAGTRVDNEAGVDPAEEIERIFEKYKSGKLARHQVRPIHFTILHKMGEIPTDDEAKQIAYLRACEIRSNELYYSNERKNIILAEIYRKGQLDDPLVEADAGNLQAIINSVLVTLSFQRKLQANGQGKDTT